MYFNDLIESMILLDLAKRQHSVRDLCHNGTDPKMR